MARSLTVLTALTLLLCTQAAEKVFLQRAGMAFNSRSYSSLLTVANGEQFGNWTWPEMCPQGFFAVGFSLRVRNLLSVLLRVRFPLPQKHVQ